MSAISVYCACPAGGERALTKGEVALVRSVFGDAIDTAPVRVRRRKWFLFQPRLVIMAPCGHLHFHPKNHTYSDDFSGESSALKGLFIHEMVHVWQAQVKGRFYLPLMRHPFCRYHYTYRPGRAFSRYGIEQQAEIVRHAFMARIGQPVPGAPEPELLEALLPF